LALVLTELLQNALQHGLAGPDHSAVGLLEVSAAREATRLTVTVSDNGVGLPAEFDLDETSSLGLQIVRTLVLTELGGTLDITPRSGGGTQVAVSLPLGDTPTALADDEFESRDVGSAGQRAAGRAS
jgi:two-component sensor histidine kinase